MSTRCRIQRVKQETPKTEGKKLSSTLAQMPQDEIDSVHSRLQNLSSYLINHAPCAALNLDYVDSTGWPIQCIKLHYEHTEHKDKDKNKQDFQYPL